MTAEGGGKPIGERINEQRAVVRAGLEAKGQQLISLGGMAFDLSKRAARASGDAIDHAYTLSRRKAVTVNGLTVTFPILPEGKSLLSRKKIKNVKAENVESSLVQTRGRLKSVVSRGQVKVEKEPISRERIGLPIIIQMPVLLKDNTVAERRLKNSAEKNKNFAGKTVIGVNNRSDEGQASNSNSPRENIAYLEVGQVTPASNYLHRLRFGLGAVALTDRNTLISTKSIAIKTPNATPQGTQGIDFSPENVVVDDVAEAIMKWVSDNSVYTVRKTDVYDALTIAARLNIGMENFWKTVHARQKFQSLRELHPEVVAFALNSFLASNKPLETLPALNAFYADLEKGKFRTYSDFVNGARAAVANIDPSARLSINLGLGGIQHFMRQTASTILNKTAVQEVLNRVSGNDEDPSVHDELLITADPLSVILMTPRFLTKIIEFTVTKYIPLVEETIEANLEAVEAGLKTSRSAAIALRDFNVKIDEAFRASIPAINKEIEKRGPEVAERLAESVVNMLNTAADETLGVNAGMTYVKHPTIEAIGGAKTVIAGKMETLLAKKAKATKEVKTIVGPGSNKKQ